MKCHLKINLETQTGVHLSQLRCNDNVRTGLTGQITEDSTNSGAGWKGGRAGGEQTGPIKVRYSDEGSRSLMP